MRNINFIQPVPPHRHKELQRWFFGSALVLISICIAFAVFTGIQWRIYRSLTTEKNSLMQKLVLYDQTMNKQHEQTAQKNALLKKLEQLQAYTDKPKNPLDIIKTVQKILGTMPLQSLTIDTDHFELKGTCSHAKQATHLVGKLNALPLCKNAQLHAISSNNTHELEFTIKGSLV